VEPERHLLTRAALLLGLTLGLVTVVACGRATSDVGGGAARGGAGGAGGAAGGTGAGRGGSGGAEDLSSVAEPLDGFVFRAPCGADVGGRLCETSTERPYPRASDPVLVGARLVDTTVTLGGETTALYDIELSVEGIVEAKNYTGGEDQSQASELPADGFYAGGRPGVGNAASVYLLRVAEPPMDYFLNAVGTADDTRLRRSVFPVKYTATVRARGGTTVRLVLADPNAHAVRNCADPDEDGCSAVAHDFMASKLRSAAALSDEPFDGQVLGLLVSGVTRAPAP
jgi:hypothetical protein